MKTDPRLEAYLARLEKVLKPFSPSERAEVVVEIKSHILSSLENDKNAQLDTVLRALGEPEFVANRYLMERGMKPAKPPVAPIVRWLVIGSLGMATLFSIIAVLVVLKFSPIMKVDEDNNHVSFLGGLIDIKTAGEKTFEFKTETRSNSEGEE